ncbi:MAG: competence/damage-inducible protein A [Actinomycetota bacterium]
MRAEVVAVGTELLLGDIINTNAAMIARALADAGVDCRRQVVVGDNPERIAAAITEGLDRADAVILTGGLGPTQDDVTREAIATALGRPLRRSSEIEQSLREQFGSLGRPMPEMNVRQADVPEGARVIDRTFGTAPGLIVEHEGRVVYAIPGVPSEMRDMLARAVIPDLLARAGGDVVIRSRIVRVAGVGESSVATSLAPIWDSLGDGVTMAFLAAGGEVRVRLTAKAQSEGDVDERLGAAESAVRETLGRAVVGSGDVTLESVVAEMLLARGWTLGCAESVTGGLLSSRLVSVPGASRWFCGAVVAYGSEVKEAVLGVANPVLAENGPVSAPVALAMAEGARARLACDVAVAVTGVAGPQEQGRPVGTVVIAVVGPAGSIVREIRVPGDRSMIRTLATTAALNLVRLSLLEEES